jgi:apolipoprotein N-acyltransferase
MEYNVKMNKRFLLSALSGVLLVICFPFTGGLTPLVFIALVPILFVEDQLISLRKKQVHLFLYSYLTFFIYNLGTTWWIYKSSITGALLAFLFNSLLMSLAFQVYHIIHRKIGKENGIWAILLVWPVFEWLHFNWELSWPWLTFGNIFSTHVDWVQWYEITGVLGGTLWILLANTFIFKYLKNYLSKKDTAIFKGFIILASCILIFPIILSKIILSSLVDQTKNKKYEVVVVQPNIDPYNEKFDPSSTVENQLLKMFQLANNKVSSKTDLVVCPETAISLGFIENELKAYSFYQLLDKQLKSWKKIDLLIGASTYRIFKKKQSRACVKIPNAQGYFESYNSSLYLSRKNKASFIHKSKLVLGVEKIPFSHYFPFLEKLSIDNGGTSGTLGIEPYPKIFKRRMIVAPIVCYESIYGEFVAKQVAKGADFLCVLTNDGWWGNTPGHKQHFSFASLRAIENRKWVARSANTGISGFINEKGHVVQSSKWWEPASMKQTIFKSDTKTFYARHGDYLGKLTFGILAMMILISILKKKKLV